MIGVGERGGEIGGTRARRAVEPGLERVALAGAKPLRQAPAGAAAGEREAHHRAGREAVIEPGRAACRRGGKIVAADHRGIAAGAIAAAVARAPRAPALLEARRLFQYLCVGEGDVVGQLCALGRKADRGAAERVASAVNEGIEHDAEELVGELERALLRAGRGSPESCDSALPRLAPVSRKMVTKAGGSAPPLLKNALSPLATLHWLRLKAQASAPGPLGLLGARGPLLGPTGCPSVAVRFKVASVAV